ncbi:hypothetical protein HK096_006819 [Nowakowskiella sp. JEL0078]|nr:hypothetical protein HK096_006819 [Nowakowskiella sp. JEL0078]
MQIANFKKSNLEKAKAIKKAISASKMTPTTAEVNSVAIFEGNIGYRFSRKEFISISMSKGIRRKRIAWLGVLLLPLVYSVTSDKIKSTSFSTWSSNKNLAKMMYSIQQLRGLVEGENHANNAYADAFEAIVGAVFLDSGFNLISVIEVVENICIN